MVKKYLISLILILVICISTLVCYKYFLTVDYVDVQITKLKDKNQNTAEDRQYLVYTIKLDDRDGEAFKVVDDMFFLHFNSADVYASIEMNKKYQFKVQGIRIGFMSWFRNVLSVKEI